MVSRMVSTVRVFVLPGAMMTGNVSRTPKAKPLIPDTCHRTPVTTIESQLGLKSEIVVSFRTQKYCEPKSSMPEGVERMRKGLATVPLMGICCRLPSDFVMEITADFAPRESGSK